MLERVRTDAAKDREHAEGVLRDQIERVKDSQKQMRVRSEIMHKIIGEKKDREVEGLRVEVKRLQDELMQKGFEITKVQM